MSVINEVTGDIYRQMIELQEKLKQSEAERVRLEGMFSVLVKTFKEEEDKRLKNLESRYQTFLEDCAKRSNRNEKILRSVERVESGANVLYAKTERLKQLRSHYEAYLERVMPSWRQPPQLRYGSTPYLPEMEWTGRNHLILDDDSMRGNYPGFGKPRRGTQSFQYPEKYSESERSRKPFPSTRVNKNFWTQDSKKFDERNRVLYGSDRSYPDDYRRERFDEGDFNDDDEVFDVKTGLNQPKSTVESRRDETDDIWNERSRDLPEKTPIKPSDGTTGPDEWPRSRKSQDELDIRREYDERPRITREPVEIKKPEFIVGKLHPEATSKFEYLNRVPGEVKPASPPSVKSPTPPVTEPIPGDRSETDVQPKQIGRWSMLKHRATIDQLRETLKKQEEILKTEEPVKQDEDTDVSQSLSEGWQAKDSPLDDANKLELTERNTPAVEYSDEPQEEYEDNEEAYPESYYEQPSKPNNYSRNIVGNVILEEDESEVNANDDVPVQNQESNPGPTNNVEETNESQYVEDVPYNAGEQQDVVYSGNENGYDKAEPLEGGYEYQNQTGYEYPNPEYYEQQQEQTIDGQNVENLSEEYKEGQEEFRQDQQYQPEYSQDQQYQQEYNQNQQYQQEYAEGQQYQQDYNQDQQYEQGYSQDQQYQPDYIQDQQYQQEYPEGQQYPQDYDPNQIPTDGNYYNAEEQQYYQDGQYEQGGDGYGGTYAPGDSENPPSEVSQGESKQLPLRQSNLAHLLESDSESFQIEHGSAPVNEDSDFDFSISQQQ